MLMTHLKKKEKRSMTHLKKSMTHLKKKISMTHFKKCSLICLTFSNTSLMSLVFSTDININININIQ